MRWGVTTRSPSPVMPPSHQRALRAVHRLPGARAALNDLGIGRNDRVAIVLPNGPEMAAAFLCVASAAASAPLNPAYRQDEFEFYLGDLAAKALIVEAGSDLPALRAAEKLGVALITLTPGPQAGAGAFQLSGSAAGASALSGPAEPDDVALILHTSGTTSRPKIVPLTQANIWTLHATSQPRSSFPTATAPSTSCPCFTFTGSSLAWRRRSRAAAPSFARPGSTRSNSLPRWRRPSPPGTRPCRPCIRRS